MTSRPSRRRDRPARSRCALRGTRRRPPRSPRARSSRSRRRAGRPGRPRRPRASSSAQLVAAPAPAGRLRARRQRMSGSRRIVPRPEQGASTRTRSNAAANGSAPSAGHVHDVRCARRRSSRTVSRSSAIRRGRTSHATIDARVVHVRRHRGRLAAGRGAEIEHALAGPRADDQRHQLRRFVLHEERARPRGRRSGLPDVTTRPSRRVARRRGLDVVVARARARSSSRGRRSGWRAASAAASRC